jgi:MFS family permease
MIKPGAALVRERSFLWLLGGGVLSMLGDQFTLVAVPWLVLKMTGDPVEVGLVLAVIGVPRALFILFGGAMVDRTSSKRVLLITKYVNTLLLGGLALLVASDALTLPLVYVLALAIGLTSSFSFPAGTAILPQVVAEDQLQGANAAMMTFRQITLLLGPLLAGLLIALFGDGTGGLGRHGAGLAAAFLLDCLSFAISAWTLGNVILRAETTAGKPLEPVLRAISQGLAALWQDRALRALCLYYGATAFFIGGPIQVALPVLADRNLSEGAAGFGVLMAVHGCGALAGMVISGARPSWKAGNLGKTILLFDGVAGLIFLPYGFIHALWLGIVLMLPLGAMAGYMQVSVFSWMQRRVAPEMIGRAMSVFMFIFFGLAPLSAAVAGWVLGRVGVPFLFAVSGASLLAIVLLARLGGRIGEIGSETAEAAV